MASFPPWSSSADRRSSRIRAFAASSAARAIFVRVIVYPPLPPHSILNPPESFKNSTNLWTRSRSPPHRGICPSRPPPDLRPQSARLGDVPDEDLVRPLERRDRAGDFERLRVDPVCYRRRRRPNERD